MLPDNQISLQLQSSWLELFRRLSPTSINLGRLRFLVFTSLLFISNVVSTGTSGCGCDLPMNLSPGGSSVQVPIQQFNGLNRTYLIHIPMNYDQNTPTPLIFSFHGRDRDSFFQETLSGFSRPEWNPDAITVYPQGINNLWQGDPDSFQVDDIDFVSTMISSLSRTYCLDTERIYAAGKSNGGGFINRLACDPQLSTKIAAFAPVSVAIYIPSIKSIDCVGSIPQTANIPCYPGRRNIPVLEFHGLQDNVISYYGGPRRSGCLISILHWLKAWADLQGYGSEATRTSLFDGNIIKLEFAPATKNQGIITHYAINNWSHDWPSTKPTLDSEDVTYINATPLIIDFFNSHPL